MSKAKHTPTPWEYVPPTEHHGPYITSEFGSTIADFYVMSEPGALSTASGGTSKPISFLHEMAAPNAEFAIRCVNSHAQLVEALKDADRFITNVIEFGYIRMPTYIGDAALKTPGIIRAALAAAEVKP